MEYWQEQALLKKERELLKKEYPLIGTIVRYAGEYGVIVKATHGRGAALFGKENSEKNRSSNSV